MSTNLDEMINNMFYDKIMECIKYDKPNNEQLDRLKFISDKYYTNRTITKEQYETILKEIINITKNQCENVIIEITNIRIE